MHVVEEFWTIFREKTISNKKKSCFIVHHTEKEVRKTYYLRLFNFRIMKKVSNFIEMIRKIAILQNCNFIKLQM